MKTDMRVFDIVRDVQIAAAQSIQSHGAEYAAFIDVQSSSEFDSIVTLRFHVALPAVSVNPEQKEIPL